MVSNRQLAFALRFLHSSPEGAAFLTSLVDDLHGDVGKAALLVKAMLWPGVGWWDGGRLPSSATITERARYIMYAAQEYDGRVAQVLDKCLNFREYHQSFYLHRFGVDIYSLYGPLID